MNNMFFKISILHSQCLGSGPDYLMNFKYEIYQKHSTLNTTDSGATGTETDSSKQSKLLLLMFRH